jgi:hypothetical protein
MNLVESILRSHPQPDQQHVGDYAEVVEALQQCALICTSCADACLAEKPERLRRCIRTDLDCADVCATTARLILRQTETPNDLVHAQLHACVVACQQCSDECDAHAQEHAHCRICAETCRHCQERCNYLLGEISSAGVDVDAANPSESPSMR